MLYIKDDFEDLPFNYRKKNREGKYKPFIDYEFSGKVSNIMLSRLVNTASVGNCSYCYPHGHETKNSTISKNKRSWKYNRKNQYHGK